MAEIMGRSKKDFLMKCIFYKLAVPMHTWNLLIFVALTLTREKKKKIIIRHHR